MTKRYTAYYAMCFDTFISKPYTSYMKIQVARALFMHAGHDVQINGIVPYVSVQADYAATVIQRHFRENNEN
jgi:hypothetical protein